MQQVNIKDIFSSVVREFSLYDCVRSLPSGIDGFKPSARKIIYGMCKKFPTQEVKVNIAAAGIQEVSCYHHGSLEGTIVNMAQSFPGSNNLPFLEDIGQFGSRISPTASASRYIYTKLSDAFRRIYLKTDDDILVHLEDDGTVIEPEYYLPIIPTVLLNGCDGMGTGFATRILNYNPVDLVDACVEVLKHNKIKQELTPWYRGFTGTVSKTDVQTTFTGCFTVMNSTTLVITELPIGMFTQKYREHLNTLEDRGIIKNYVDNSSEEKTEFVITAPRDTVKMSVDEINKLFKLTARDTENFTVWNEKNVLRKFKYAKDLIEWFVAFRLDKYKERINSLILKSEQQLYSYQELLKFIEYYLQHSDWFAKNNKATILSKLTSLGFKNSVDLLNVKVYNLTLEQIELLKERIVKETKLLDTLKNTQPTTMYFDDLKDLKLFLKTKL